MPVEVATECPVEVAMGCPMDVTTGFPLGCLGVPTGGGHGMPTGGGHGLPTRVGRGVPTGGGHGDAPTGNDALYVVWLCEELFMLSSSGRFFMFSLLSVFLMYLSCGKGRMFPFCWFSCCVHLK